MESIDEGLQILQTVAESAEKSADTTAHLISKKKVINEFLESSKEEFLGIFESNNLEYLEWQS